MISLLINDGMGYQYRDVAVALNSLLHAEYRYLFLKNSTKCNKLGNVFLQKTHQGLAQIWNFKYSLKKERHN